MRLLATSLIVLTVAAGAAQAADPIVPFVPEVPEPIVSWGGPYIGVSLGGGGAPGEDIVEPEVEAGQLVALSGIEYEGDEYDISGWLIGGFAGVGLQQGRFVFGVEGDINAADISGDWEYGTLTVDALGSLRGRAGIAFDSVLVYGTAGLAVGHISVWDQDYGDEDSWHLGWTAGAGVEVLLTDNVALRGEYRFTSLEEKLYFDGFEDPSTLGASFHTGTIGLRIGL